MEDAAAAPPEDGGTADQRNRRTDLKLFSGAEILVENERGAAADGIDDRRWGEADY